ncbi:neuronal acetylcholine receptor subunit alpha-3-like isoform X2 [Stylophora pistillata]|uniref:neuronal acetylcholine receptor subunit alpha-3-like isoform X2 n=1 Tax=Stylophora pistillata TaxID=50429 RepID=UPI000C0494B5|nr:neuronal acetylcholine receptor subunit alpha-3-like isoform X2 [Stylophora pistillata]
MATCNQHAQMLSLILFLSIIVAGLDAQNSTSKKREQHLLEDLLNPENYNRRVRPVVRSEDPVIVKFGLVVREIEDLDDKNQLLLTRAEIREYWVDPQLKWDSSKYGGVEYISVDPKMIWIPDIVLYDNAGVGFGSGMTRTKAVITKEGLVSLNVPTIIKSSCKIYVKNYPFDQQECKLKFGSWTYDALGIALQLENSSADLSEYSPSVAWELLGVPGEFHSLFYNCCVNPYDDVTYRIQIKRRALYHAMFLIIPCAMISVLTLLVFLLPPDCNERMTVGMAILVGLSFFFLLVAEKMPATSEAVPLVGMYYTVTMIEVSCAFFMTCWVLRFHHQNPTEGEVPKWVYLLGYGAKLFRFKFENSNPFGDSLQDSDVPSAESIAGHTMNDKETLVAKDTKLRNNTKRSGNSQNHVPDDKKSTNKILADNVRQQMILQARQDEWRKAALVLNHICIWIFVLAVVVSFMAIFLQAPF